MTGVDPDAARERARAVLRQRRFRPLHTPRIARGPFTWLGRRIQSLTRWVGNLVVSVTESGIAGWLIAALLLVVLGSAITLVVRHRVRGRIPDRSEGGSVVAATDPAVLEAEADAAEGVGDYQLAVRLRFVAGLLRLERFGVLASTRRRTNRQVAVSLARVMETSTAAQRTSVLGTFAELATGFDALLYGHRPAVASDSTASRAGWRIVLDAVGYTQGRRAA